MKKTITTLLVVCSLSLTFFQVEGPNAVNNPYPEITTLTHGWGSGDT